MLLLLGHGRLSLSLGEIMHYAIGYARAGTRCSRTAGIASVAQVFREHWPGSAPHGSDSTARPAFWAASRSSSPVRRQPECDPSGLAGGSVVAEWAAAATDEGRT